MAKVTKTGPTWNIECPACGSRNIIYRKSDDVTWCRRCGCEFKQDARGRRIIINKKDS